MKSDIEIAARYEVLKIWDEECGFMDYMGSREALRASEKGIGMVIAVLWGDSFWQPYPRELALKGNEAGGKEVSWVVTVELGTRVLRKVGHTPRVRCVGRERGKV